MRNTTLFELILLVVQFTVLAILLLQVLTIFHNILGI